MATVAATPFPPAVADKLKQMATQLEALEKARTHYLAGVLDTLGVPGPVSVDFNALTYSPVAPAETTASEDEP